MEHMFYYATEMVFRLEKEYMGLDCPDVTPEITQEIKLKYEDILEEKFLDPVFGSDSILDRPQWEKDVAAKANWVLNPESIRKMLGYKY